jgi:hypothetical protein
LLLDRAGATLNEAMELARHSDPKLPMAVDGRGQLHDLGAAVDSTRPILPSLSGPVVLASTGTEVAPRPRLDQTNHVSCENLISDEITDRPGQVEEAQQKTPVLQGFMSGCASMITSEKARRDDRQRNYSYDCINWTESREQRRLGLFVATLAQTA